MCPDCSAPRMLPAPRISRSRSAILKPAPSCGELLDRLEPLDRVGRDRLVGFEQQVGVGAVLVAADPAAKLVQVGQAVLVGLVDEDRVDVGDVQAALDDRRGDQDVVLPPDEGQHRPLELLAAHLAVADGDPGLGDDRLDLVGDGLDVVDPVVDEVDLAVAIELAVDGPLDDLGVEAGDAGLDRLAVRRRRLQVGDVADAQQAHVQGPRDRRGREGQDVDGRAQGLEPFLVLDAEPLLLVDDDQPQVLERDVFLEDPVGADQDVDAAGGGPLEDVADLRPWAGTG